MKKKQKKTVCDDQSMNLDAADVANISSEEEDEESHEGTSEEDSGDGLMADELENADLLDFDFEALPLHQNDREGIVNMLTQMFLRADVEVESMADKMIERSPLGCVYLPAEDNADDGNENVVYGVLSILPLNPDEGYANGFWSLLIERSKKYAMDKTVITELESLSCGKENSRVVLLVNERMLHFSSAIAKPAFQALILDLEKNKDASDFTHVIVIMKIRIADTGIQLTHDVKKGKRKLGKAEKRRLRALAAANSEVIFDNPEEKLLFEDKEEVKFFQYPVQSDVERDSKFNATIVHGVTFRPYRRVCIMNHKLFDRFIRSIASYTP